MIILGLFLPFVGTALGAAMVFFMRSRLQSALHQFLLGFACGVMLAASIWSLLLPSLALAEGCRLSFLPASIGFLCGIAFLIFLEHLTERLPSLGEVQSPVGGSFRQTMLLVLAVTLHNIPEGMAVGVALAAARENAGIAMSGALALSAGIAIQNLPEGAIIAMPLRSEGYSKGASFGCGVLSGVVEPVFGAFPLPPVRWSMWLPRICFPRHSEKNLPSLRCAVLPQVLY